MSGQFSYSISSQITGNGIFNSSPFYAVNGTFALEKLPGSAFTTRFQEKSLSFSPRFYSFESIILSDWLNRPTALANQKLDTNIVLLSKDWLAIPDELVSDCFMEVLDSNRC